MPEKPLFEVYWTDNAFNNASQIKNYLSKNFSEKEVAAFYSLLAAFESVVNAFPYLYPSTKNNIMIRRAVLNKHLSVFYRIQKNRIEVLAAFDSRKNLTDWN